MTSQTGKLIIAIKKKKKTLWPLFMGGVQLPQGQSHSEEAVYFLPLVPNISKTKGSQTMKFGELIEYNIRKISLKNHAVNEAGRLVLGKSSW